MNALQGSKGTFAAALASVLLAAGCAQRTGSIADRIRASDLRHLPQESVGLAVVEMKSLRDRGGAERWLDEIVSGLNDAPSLQTIRNVMGADAVRKVDRVALALVPQSGGETGYAVLAEGGFEEPKMRELTGGRDILTLVEVAGRPDVSLTILPGGSPVFGPRAVLERVRQVQGRREAGLAEAGFLRILGKVRPEAQVWGAIDYAPLAELARRALRDGERSVPLPPIGSATLQALAFQGQIEKSVAFDLFGQADGESGARQLADAARGLVALARMSASQQEARTWLEFLDGIRIDQSGQEIQVHGTLTSAMAQALAGRFPGAGGSQLSPGSPAEKEDAALSPRDAAAPTGAPSEGARRPPS